MGSRLHWGNLEGGVFDLLSSRYMAGKCLRNSIVCAHTCVAIALRRRNLSFLEIVGRSCWILGHGSPRQ